MELEYRKLKLNGLFNINIMPLSLSSGDWIRIQRLKSAKGYGIPTTGVLATNEDVVNVASLSNPISPPTLQTRVVGSSKTRRENSKWIDYMASHRCDYTLKSKTSSGATQLKLVKINCNCGTISGANTSILTSKLAGCAKCNPAQHLRI